MKDWIEILTFTYPHEAHLVKGKLESEGVKVQIKDEMTIQVHNFYSNAIGGVKLLVKESDFHKASQILSDSGYITSENYTDNKLLIWIDQLTSRFPLIGKTILEIRLIAFIMTFLIIIAIPIVLMLIPTKMERLTEKSWCVDRIYYKGQELTPNSLGLKMESNYDNCSETMTFRKNGIVTFPGIDSYGDRCRWELRNDSLFITEWSISNNYELGDNLEIIETEDKTEKSIFNGVYDIEIKNNMIKMQSDNLIILGKVYSFNFSF